MDTRTLAGLAGGRDRDRTCDPYHVKREIALSFNCIVVDEIAPKYPSRRVRSDSRESWEFELKGISVNWVELQANRQSVTRL